MKKKPVAVLGATGMVGRRLVERLINHPWFDVQMIVGSSGSTGEAYAHSWKRKETEIQDYYGMPLWKSAPVPEQVQHRYVQGFEELLESDIELIFSSVPERASELEKKLLDKGCILFSNSPYGRLEDKNPLVVPEVNGEIMKKQRFIKYPNCVTSGLVLVLKPIVESYGLKEVSITTYQSLSGRGDAKYPKELVIGNIYPLHDASERSEEYIANEVKKILQERFPLSVTCNRVFVQEGHYVEVRIKTHQAIDSAKDIAALLEQYAPLRNLRLPSAPEHPMVVIDVVGRPRPVQDSWHHNGMAVAVGNISIDDEVYDVRLTYVVNNLIRGAAGGALLSAEMYFKHFSS